VFYMRQLLASKPVQLIHVRQAGMSHHKRRQALERRKQPQVLQRNGIVAHA